MHTFAMALIMLAAGGALPLLLHRWPRFSRSSHTVLVALGCLAGLYGLYQIWQDQTVRTITHSWLGIFQLSFSLDSISTAFLVPILAISPLIAIFSYHYLDKPAHSWRTAVNQCFFCLLILAMIFVTLAADMVTFALAWELMSLSSWFLILYDFEKEETQKASYIYLLFTQAGALFLFAAFGLAYQGTGLFAFSQLSQLPHGLKLAVFLLALVGFGSKAGVFPLHIWLPHAHPAAPSHVSALLSGIMIKMGIYGLIRIYLLLNDPAAVFPQVVMILGMISGILGVAYALGKHDIKRLLAYHSIENIGIILIGLGLGMLGITSGDMLMAVLGFTGGLLHVLNHAIFKSLLFLGAGSVIKTTGTRHLDQLGGLMKTMPVTGQTFLAGSVAIAGLPPLNGFISEFLIYFSAFQGLRLNGSSFLLSLFAIVSLAVIGGLASGCFTKVVGVVFLGEPRSEAGIKATDPGFTMCFAMIFLAILCVIIGVWPEPFLLLTVKGLSSITPFATISPEIFGTIPSKLAFAARLLLGLCLVVYLARQFLSRNKPAGTGATWGCGFTQPTTRMQYTATSYARSMVEFHRPLVTVQTKYPGIKAIFPGTTAHESKVADVAEIGLHRTLTRPLIWAANKLHWIQHGRIQLYIAYIILTIVVLLLTI